MKRIVLYLIWSSFCLLCVGQSGNVIIKSDVRNLQARDHIKLLRWDGKNYVATDSIKNGVDNTLQAEIEKPEIAFLEIGRNKAMPIFLSHETFFLSGDATKHKTLMVKGNNDQNIYNRYLFLLDAFDKRMEKLDFECEQAQRLNKINEVKRLTNEMQKVTQERSEFMEKYALTHASSLVSAYIAKNILPSLSIPQLEALVRTYIDESLEDPIVTEIQNRLTILQNTSIGREIFDFTFTDKSGKPSSIHDLRGKYTLVYFWASWCTNCLKENVTLKALHEKYEGRGFEIVAISMDTDKLRWQKRIKDDHLDWIHICDFEGTESSYIQPFGITAIPMAFLLDIDNVIIENSGVLQNLEDKLEQVLGTLEE